MNEVLNLYNSLNESEKKNFHSSIKTTLNISEKGESSSYDDEWLVKMEETIRYLDNILRNPNRFIVNEEEIVKIELARRITVDSIKHLSRNTNLIQNIDEETGEVKPSKILNINKEESFNTYENRFIYTLVNNMKLYIERKKGETIEGTNSDSHKDFSYSGSAKVNHEDVKITVSLKCDTKQQNKKGEDITGRISKLEEKVRDLCASEVYKNIAKLHVSPVTSPIKKTNLILKNVNFQYALELWNYMQTHMEPSSKHSKIDNHYEDNGKLKQMMDDSFLINYLIINSTNENREEIKPGEIESKIANNTVNQLLNLKDELSLEEVMKLVGDEYVRVKYKKVIDTTEIARKYKEAIELYMNKEHDWEENEEDENY